MDAKKVLGYLKYRVDAKTSSDYKTIANGTGIDWRAVPDAISELVKSALAKKDGKGWRHLEPGEFHKDWFALQKGGKRKGEPLFFRIYILTDRKTITSATNNLYWQMVNLDAVLTDGTTRLRRNTKSGLAALLGVKSRETIHDGLKKLEKLGLFHEGDDNELHVHAPTRPDLWKMKRGRSDDLDEKLSAQDIIDQWTLDGVSDDEVGYLYGYLGKALDSLRKSNYLENDIQDFICCVRVNLSVAQANFYLSNLPEYINQSDDWHNREDHKTDPNHKRCSIRVLKSISRKRWFAAARENSPQERTDESNAKPQAKKPSMIDLYHKKKAV
jgi:hypothetical protein